jgi:hypothetical protein
MVRPSHPARGADRESSRTRVGCDGRGQHQAQVVALLRTMPTRTAKACGPDAPGLASSLRVTNPQATVTRRSRTPRRASTTPLKPLRGEGRGSGSTCSDYARVLFFSAREAAGAAGTRLSLRPRLEKAGELQSYDSGAMRRGNAGLYPRRGRSGANQEVDPAVVSAAKFFFGNRVLTLLGVWLGV